MVESASSALVLVKPRTWQSKRRWSFSDAPQCRSCVSSLRHEREAYIRASSQLIDAAYWQTRSEKIVALRLGLGLQTLVVVNEKRV